MKIIILALLLFAGCSETIVNNKQITDIQSQSININIADNNGIKVYSENREGCILAQLTMIQGIDTVKANYWITSYYDSGDFRTLYNMNGVLITIYIPSIIAWREDNYCEK